ncbi:unnamed protein product [Microthlaspi erraticum]|uniref:Uncharacterized protein n=1 Tax=Microthlaspi erraticum TaxID=1685480 RepID=A0A6D2K053_9BRAS|nr:unnamed protein product [Microthlaspi erraticum]
MRIEGEKGVKTQSAPKHWPRTRKSEFWPSKFQSGRPYGRAGKEKPCSAGFYFARQKRSRGTHEPGKNRPRSADSYRNGPTVPVDPGNNARPRPKFSRHEFGRPNRSTATKSIGHKFSRPRYTMAKTKGNESMKKKKNPFMEPPKKQIKLGSSSSNARAAIPTSPHSIDAIKNMWRVQEEEKMIGHL